MALLAQVQVLEHQMAPHLGLILYPRLNTLGSIELVILCAA